MSVIIPQWPAPENVFSAITTREGGVSLGPYANFNMGVHVGDDPAVVNENRYRLINNLSLPEMPHWLTQVHGVKALDLPAQKNILEADAAYTRARKVICAVLTADCLPLLVCNQQGTEVAAIHAGWKGLAAGVVEATIAQLKSPRNDLMAYLGPAISQANFEVGMDVFEAFLSKNKEHELAFKPGLKPNTYKADLYLIARQKLKNLKIDKIYGGEYCTYAQSQLFYSFRRDQGMTGRMASLIYIR